MSWQESKLLGSCTLAGVKNVGMNRRRWNLHDMWKYMSHSAACKYRPTLCSDYGVLNQNKVKEPNSTIWTAPCAEQQSRNDHILLNRTSAHVRLSGRMCFKFLCTSSWKHYLLWHRIVWMQVFEADLLGVRSSRPFHEIASCSTPWGWSLKNRIRSRIRCV